MNSRLGQGSGAGMGGCLPHTEPAWALVPTAPPGIQGFAKQAAALTWKESDSGHQESWNESGGRD